LKRVGCVIFSSVEQAKEQGQDGRCLQVQGKKINIWRWERLILERTDASSALFTARWEKGASCKALYYAPTGDLRRVSWVQPRFSRRCPKKLPGRLGHVSRDLFSGTWSGRRTGKAVNRLIHARTGSNGKIRKRGKEALSRCVGQAGIRVRAGRTVNQTAAHADGVESGTRPSRRRLVVRTRIAARASPSSYDRCPGRRPHQK